MDAVELSLSGLAPLLLSDAQEAPLFSLQPMRAEQLVEGLNLPLHDHAVALAYDQTSLHVIQSDDL